MLGSDFQRDDDMGGSTMRKRIGAAFALAMILSGVTACGGSDAPESENAGDSSPSQAAAVAPTPTETAAPQTEAAEPEATAEISESGFGQDGNYAWVTAMVHNVGSVGEFATVQFNLYDEAGTLLASAEQVESFVAEDGWTAIGTIVEVPNGQQVARVEPTLALSDYGMGGEPMPTIGPIDVTLGDNSATFVVKNDTSENWEGLRIGIICRDDAGGVAGGGMAFPALVPAGSESMVDGTMVVSDAATSCTAYPNHGGY